MCKYCESKKNFDYYKNNGKEKFSVTASIFKNQLRILGYGCTSVRSDEYYESWGLECGDTDTCGGNGIFEINYCPICGKKLVNSDNNIVVFYLCNNHTTLDSVYEQFKREQIITKYYPIDKQMNVLYSYKYYDDTKFHAKNFIKEKLIDHRKKETSKRIFFVKFNDEMWNDEQVKSFLIDTCGYSPKHIVNANTDNLNKFQSNIAKALHN